jgi:hypothetical protein
MFFGEVLDRELDPKRRHLLFLGRERVFSKKMASHTALSIDS